MCIAQDRINKTAPKASIKLPVAKHELVATSVGKAHHHPTGLPRNTSNDTLTTVASHESHATTPSSSAAIACPSSPTKEEDIVNSSIHQEQDDFDFDFSFLQIPTGGIIDFPRHQDHHHEDDDAKQHNLTSANSFASEATIPTTHIRMRPKPLDLSSLGIVLKPKYRGRMVQRQLQEEDPTTPPLPTMVASEDFVYETPKMQRIVTGSMTTPPTTPRASGHPSFFVDYAKIPESLLMPIPF